MMAKGGKLGGEQTCLDLLKLVSVEYVVFAVGQELSDFRLEASDALFGQRVIGEAFCDLGVERDLCGEVVSGNLSHLRFLVLFNGVQFFESVQQCLRIVAGSIGILNGEKVSFVLGIAAELLHGKRSGKSANVSGTGACGSRYIGDGVNDPADISPRHSSSGVAGGDVSDFVSHHGGELGFIISRKNQGAIHIKETAGQAVSAGNVAGVDHFYGKRNLGVGVADDFLSQTIDVRIHLIVVDRPGGAVEACSHVAAKFEFMFYGIEIEAAANAALPNVLDVVFL